MRSPVTRLGNLGYQTAAVSLRQERLVAGSSPPYDQHDIEEPNTWHCLRCSALRVCVTFVGRGAAHLLASVAVTVQHVTTKVKGTPCFLDRLRLVCELASYFNRDGHVPPQAIHAMLGKGLPF